MENNIVNRVVELQDNLSVLQAENAQNDANFVLSTAQYNQRKNIFARQITALQASITSAQNVPSNQTSS